MAENEWVLARFVGSNVDVMFLAEEGWENLPSFHIEKLSVVQMTPKLEGGTLSIGGSNLGPYLPLVGKMVTGLTVLRSAIIYYARPEEGLVNLAEELWGKILSDSVIQPATDFDAKDEIRRRRMDGFTR